MSITIPATVQLELDKTQNAIKSLEDKLHALECRNRALEEALSDHSNVLAKRTATCVDSISERSFPEQEGDLILQHARKDSEEKRLFVLEKAQDVMRDMYNALDIKQSSKDEKMIVAVEYYGATYSSISFFGVPFTMVVSTKKKIWDWHIDLYGFASGPYTYKGVIGVACVGFGGVTIGKIPVSA